MRRRSGVTLIELLVVVAIIAALAAVLMDALPSALQHAYSAACLSNMRNLGIGFMEYAADNDGQLPGRVGGNSDKWPVLLLPYTNGPKVYVDPGDPVATAVPSDQVVSDSANNSSFFFNGFNDLGAYNNPNLTVRLVNIANASNVLLLGQKIHGSTQYYMDFVEAPSGNENDILNKTAYFGGANYTFADGSSRFMTEAIYNNITPGGNGDSDGDRMWLVNQSYSIPAVPAGH